jgi:secreted trypsin-like serine protease
VHREKWSKLIFFFRSFLTADRFLASLVALFGEYDISGELESKRSVSKNVKRVVVHRQYDAATFENDLALLELESPIHYDAHIGK